MEAHDLLLPPDRSTGTKPLALNQLPDFSMHVLKTTHVSISGTKQEALAMLRLYPKIGT